MGAENSPYEDMFLGKGDNWKRLRTISAPSFTAKRMKEVYMQVIF